MLDKLDRLEEKRGQPRELAVDAELKAGGVSATVDAESDPGSVFVSVMSKSDTHIHVLSLNCWGLKYVSKDRVQRIEAIANILSTSSYDIICLQELWVYKDYDRIRRAVSSRLPFARLFHSGAMGSGLATFSRFPIVAASLQPYSLNGHPLDLGADWFAGKAASSVLVVHPILGELQIFNTHFFSEGGDEGPEYLRAHRLVNAWEFAKVIRQSTAVGHHVIAAGDFNSAPHTLPMTIVREHSGLEDVPTGSRFSPQLGDDGGSSSRPHDHLSSHDFTYDSPLNSYASRAQTHTSVPQGKCLDYIFYRNPEPSSLASARLTFTEGRVVFTEPVPGHSFSYSDHFGVEATFVIERIDSKNEKLRASGGQAPSIAAPTPPNVQSSGLSRVHTLLSIDALQTHLGHAAARARGELCGVAACITILAAILLGTGWSPKGSLTPLFVAIGALAVYIGTTLFHIGFLFRRCEANALRNAIEEMELHVQSLGSVEH